LGSPYFLWSNAMVNPKKIANNILDFLIDPTKIPVQQRVYFRPEENLQNQIYENAKADAVKAYKDQKHNSDFYPAKNRQMREATLMDRKSLIASFDSLSRNFKENDPIGEDLRLMATAVSRMNDDEFSSRQTSGAPDFEEMQIEAKKKAKTFPCPYCGTKVLEQTGYCVKCKKKVKPKKASACEEEEATAKKDDMKEDKEVESSQDFWTKEAMTMVAKGLVSNVLGWSEDEEEATAKKNEEEEEKDATKKKDEDEEKEVSSKKKPKEEEVSSKKKPEEKEVSSKKEEDEEKDATKKKDEEKESTVNTDILASITFGNINMDAPMIEAGDMTEEEKTKLAGLFD
jgi:bifunctional autolysin